MTLPSGNGQTDSAHSVSVVFASDAPPITATIDETTLATAARQDTGNTSLVTIATNSGTQATATNQTTANSSLASIKTNTDKIPSLGAAAKASAVPVTLATDQGTDAAPIVTRQGAPQSSTDAGHTLSLPDTNSHQAGSQATTLGYALFCAPAANTKPVYMARATGVTTATGIEINPGDVIPLPCANTNEWWGITGTATQTLQIVAV